MQLTIRLLKPTINVDLQQLAQPESGVKVITVFQKSPTNSKEYGADYTLKTLQNSPKSTFKKM